MKKRKSRSYDHHLGNRMRRIRGELRREMTRMLMLQSEDAIKSRGEGVEGGGRL